MISKDMRTDITCALLDCADATGYDGEFLINVFWDAVEDGEPWRAALRQVIEIAEEQDF